MTIFQRRGCGVNAATTIMANFGGRPCWVLAICSLAIAALFSIGLLVVSLRRQYYRFNGKQRIHVAGPTATLDLNDFIPSELVESSSVYNLSDFRNARGIVPPFWGCQNNGTCIDDEIWGPCYAPRDHKAVHWAEEVERYRTQRKPSYVSPAEARKKDSGDLTNLCRPGFLIIGAGKCGTSSLYHYLTDHPRVQPAREKQIHYFKYYTKRPVKWYLEHFPTSKSFLASGALVTGEASPGYIPYPDVANLVAQRLPGPRIIAVGRNPLLRSYSSYRYNYVTPTLAAMRKGSVRGVERGQSDDVYQQYLFSFEDMMRAELKLLRECLAEDGSGYGAIETRKMWGGKPWARGEFERRERDNNGTLAPLIDLDGTCYGQTVNFTVPRRQWAELVAKYPEKRIPPNNLHLVQSFIGRSLYVLPMEWWYLSFKPEDIYFVCTEELRDRTGESMNAVGEFLGLPSYNFSKIVSAGAYNVGGHRGYDMEVSWDTIQKEEGSSALLSQADSLLAVPISEDLRRELEDFYRPYNERLFRLTGRRCNW